MAGCYTTLGRHADALKLNEETLAARKRVLPPGHTDTLWSVATVAQSLVRLNRAKEAIPVIDDCISLAVGKPFDRQIGASIIQLRMRHFMDVDDPIGCRATAVMWEKFSRTDAQDLYEAACYRAIAAHHFDKQQQPAEAAADADRAMVWLVNAVAAGYKDHAYMAKHADLAFLRGRGDFQKLLASITPRPVAPAPRRG